MTPVLRRIACVAVVALAFVVPTASAQEDVGGATQAVVYGNDDRVDWYAITDPTWQQLARSSSVALVQRPALDFGNPGAKWPPFTDLVGTLDANVTTVYGAPLCPGERFASQPSGAVCSGTLIDDDLVLTAGHCVASDADCAALLFVFDFLESADSVLESIDADDVYACDHVIARTQSVDPVLDFAIVRLDRPVVARSAVSVRPDTAELVQGTPVVVVGYGSGLPLKFDDGGSVIEPSSATLDSFVVNTDTFGGNSGSGVFADDGTLVGILASGRLDYVSAGTCTVPNVLADAQAAEKVTYAFHALGALCDGGYPSRACPGNPSPRCGDRYCSGGEDFNSCALDCGAIRCADGMCSAGETHSTCPYDCAPSTAPARGRCSAAPAASGGGSAWLIGLLFVLIRGTAVDRRRRRP